MKTLVTLFLAGFASLAIASGSPTHQPSSVEHYSYGSKLDIAKVISLSSIPDVCEVVPAQMIYEDSHGQRHTLEYQVMGDGCSNR